MKGASSNDYAEEKPTMERDKGDDIIGYEGKQGISG